MARRWLGARGGRVVGTLAQGVPLAVKGARSLRYLALTPADACARKHSYTQFDSGARAALYSGDFAEAVRDADPLAGFRRAYNACPSSDPLDRTMYVDVKTYLVDDILTKVDKMSMAVALEARVPLLDHKLLEFAATVPVPLKLRNGRSKYLLRRLLERRVPRNIVDRPKHGFTAPIGDWLRGPLTPMVDALLMDGRMKSRGIFDSAAVERLWRTHRNGSQDHGHRLWSLVMLELWFRQFADVPAVHAAAGAAA
jgi:asparagine synthase (glutamine-hydrolysing)